MNVEGAYVLVGHSFGGLLVRAFADSCPEKISGMVLVEAMNRNNFERMGPLFPNPRDGDPPKLTEMRAFWQEGWRDPSSLPEKIDFAASFADDAKIAPFAEFPLRIITAGPFLELPFLDETVGQRMQTAWLALQNQLLQFAVDSKQTRARAAAISSSVTSLK